MPQLPKHVNIPKFIGTRSYSDYRGEPYCAVGHARKLLWGAMKVGVRRTPAEERMLNQWKNAYSEAASCLLQTGCSGRTVEAINDFELNEQGRRTVYAAAWKLLGVETSPCPAANALVAAVHAQSEDVST